MERFGERLRMIRLSKGLTQSEAAAYCKLKGVSGMSKKEHFSQYERGVRYPNTKTLYAICIGLGVSADYLLGLREMEE